LAIVVRQIHVIAFLIVTNILLAGAVLMIQSTKCSTASDSDYSLLSEKIAWMNAHEFIEAQRNLTVSYLPLREDAERYIDAHNLAGRYSIYFEDLTTGAWMGIDEKETFLPASLLKLPCMVAILKKVEVGDLSLDRRVTITSDMLDSDSGTFFNVGAGYNSTVRELLEVLIKQSDNTALRALDSLLTEDEYNNAMLALGYPAYKPGYYTMISPKQYANGMRSLYFSSYLHRSFSQLALSILASTDYDTQLTRPLPKDIRVAHKYGAYVDGGYFHDCGIVYVPKRPYILCVMSHGSSAEESDTAISDISLMAYDYMNV
jgi:beta-lactamase class A